MSVVVCVLGFVLSASAIAAAPGEDRAAGVLLEQPLVGAPVDLLLGGQGAQEARAARRSSPQAFAGRRLSRVRFEGLDGPSAASAARSAFPSLTQRAAGLPLRTGQRVARYLTAHAAEVSIPGGRALVESSVPIADVRPHRAPVPFDLHLTAAGSGFTPARAKIAVRVPRRLSEGVSLPGVGVSMTPVTASGGALATTAGSLDGAAVIWGPRDGRDLSTIAKVLPGGFDLSTLLFSERSPGRLYFHIAMPSGARLQAMRGGAVRIAKGAKALAIVSPVNARDAEGTSVPASMSVRGSDLVVNVDRSGDYLYPIAVDPEINDAQLTKTTAGKRSNWEFHTSNAGRFEGSAVYEGPGAERLETKGIAEYAPAEFAYWGYQTKGVSHIYEIKTETSAHNKLAKIESFLEFLEPGGTRETKKILSTEFENTEYEKKATTLCAANASKVEECLPGSGKANNVVHFQQSATGSPGSNYKFSDVMSQGIVSIAEPTGTHSTTGYDTTSPTLEVEVEKEGKKEKVGRTNILYGAGSWMTKSAGAFQSQAADAGIGVAKTKLEYESAPGSWSLLTEHNYLEVENACQGVQCYASHSENWTLPTGLPDGEETLRYRAEEAMSGTQSLESEGKATVKIDTKAPHLIQLNGLPFGNELSEKPYELTAEATDGEGSTIASSGIKSIALFIDGYEFGTSGGSCSVAKGQCTATRTWTVNGSELGSGQHDIELVVLDNAGNEARVYEPVSIRHSTPVPIGPGSVDLQSGDFSLGATDVSLGSGLTVSRNYSSRNVTQGGSGPYGALGPQWAMSLTSTESLTEMINGGVLMTAANGKQSIFAAEGEGKFESPIGDSNLELSLEENPTTKQKLAYYLKDNGAHTSVKFTQPAGSTTWVPTKQEGTLADQTVTYSYHAEPYLEYSPPSESRPHAIVAGSDGNLWVSLWETGKIAKISPTGTILSEYAAGISKPNDMALGSDGNIWFTGGQLTSETQQITKITPTGTKTKYSLSVSARGVAAGPDGNIWFIAGGSKLAKITPSGSVTQYSLPAESSPSAITAGPDGRIWLTEEFKHKILSVSTSGAIVGEYTLPAGSKPGAITSGPDGKLWFAEAEKIGKITTSGTVTEYSLPSETYPHSIVTGPDRKLWFTAKSGFFGSSAVVATITTSGTVTTHAVAENYLKGIAVGPDANIWYAGEYPSKIGVMPTSGVNLEPYEISAPKFAGVSCEPTLNPGCRSLRFTYATSTTATGEAMAEWGKYNGHLEKVELLAYSPSEKYMASKTVASYSYDNLGRLRAEYNPQTSLKTLYAYDKENHVTALSPPGQEPWVFSYGSIAGDAGAGRLRKVMRASASTELWTSSRPQVTATPKLSGTFAPGVRLTVSNGTWNHAVGYAYQWKSCNASGGECKAIAGANNPNYTLQSGDAGTTIKAAVTATNGGGSTVVETRSSPPVQSSPRFTEYALPTGSAPFGVAAGPESKVWFTDQSSEQVGKISSAGAITEYASNTHGYEDKPEGIVNGPDGNVWYVESASHSKAIFRMTPTGTVTEFPLTRAEPRCFDITAGPDGNLWFTEEATGYIGKMSTSGTVIAEYKLPSGSQPRGITAGPDGNLWFTDYGTKKIGKITTSGTITEYATTAGNHPEGIVAGPDGNLWFTEYSGIINYAGVGASKINKITTSGTITSYALADEGAGPRAIAAGSDGKLWFTEFETSKIGKITTSGTVTEYALAAGSDPVGIASGPDGNIWYATWSSGASTIGKIGVATSENTQGASVEPRPGKAIEYGVPVSGTGAPHNMSSSEVAKWGQSDLPEEATAIFAEDEPQAWPATNYRRATEYYLDEQGRLVNVAKPTEASSYGAISTMEYNEYNDAIRTLTPANRVRALETGGSSVATSKLLDTQSTYNGEGAKEGEVEEPGTLLVETLGPQHQVKYTAGGEQKESLAREHMKYFYDQGAPEGETYRLLTETADLAQLTNHEEVEVRQVRRSYSGQSNLGWQLRAPTSVTVDPEGLNLTTTTVYDPTTGEITETRSPGADKVFNFASKFGEGGSEAGKLSSPWGVAVNSEGKLWVVDSANNRVEQFSSSGSYLTKFGEAGSGPGQLSGPRGIALDSAGHIWVADTANNRIEEFSAAGAYMATVGSLGSEAGQLKAPSAIAFDPSGNLWVADTGNNRVQKFDKEGKYVSQFGTAGSEPGQLSGPQGIAIDGSENVWVADTANNRVQEYTKGGSFIRAFGTPGAGEGQLNTPLGLAIDSSGDIWAVDSLNNRAERFTSTGKYVTQVGWTGTGTGALKEPHAAAFDATGKLWVTDGANNRLQQWSTGQNAHDQKEIYYSVGENTEGYSSCGNHPEWAGLVCETLPAKQPELMALPKLPVIAYASYNMLNEPETVTETFGGATRTKTFTYDGAGREQTSETTGTVGTSLPKVTFTYSSEQGLLEKKSAAGGGTITTQYNHLGQVTSYTDADANVAKFNYYGPEDDFQLSSTSDSSHAGASQSYYYDYTTMLRTEMIDSDAGYFWATYDVEGQLASVAEGLEYMEYPNDLCERYTRNSVGEEVKVEYGQEDFYCFIEGRTLYKDEQTPSIHGEMLSQSSTLANESYVYDAAGRLTESHETPEGEGCTVRNYVYDEESNRASSVTHAPGGGGACVTTGGTIEGHNYDEANRLADGGMSYDAYGNVTTLPAADAEGHELTSTYYVDNAVASQSQNGVTNSFYLDPEGRVRETVTGTTATISHYDGPGQAVGWTSQGANWTRNIPGIDGMLMATQKNGERPVFQLRDLQGNVAGTIGDKEGETELLSTYNSTEFGVPNAGKTPPKFAWLGALGVESSLASGVITYGSTSYVPQTGRSLQSEAVEAPGLMGSGTGAGAAFTMQEEPWGMQGAAAAAAEAPGLEAAREQTALEAAIAATTMSDPVKVMNRKKAKALGEKFLGLATWAEIAAFLDIPESIVELVGSAFGDSLGLDDAFRWLHRGGEKLIKCSKNKRTWPAPLNLCEFKYAELETFGLVYPDFGVDPKVYECLDNKDGNTVWLECWFEVHIPDVQEA